MKEEVIKLREDDRKVRRPVFVFTHHLQIATPMKELIKKLEAEGQAAEQVRVREQC